MPKNNWAKTKNKYINIKTMTMDFYALSEEQREYFRTKYAAGEDKEMLESMFSVADLTSENNTVKYVDVKDTLKVSKATKDYLQPIGLIIEMINQYYGGLATGRDAIIISRVGNTYRALRSMPGLQSAFAFKNIYLATKFIENCQELLDRFFNVEEQ